MDYIRTLRAIKRQDVNLVGTRAVDLSILFERDLLMPLSIVITTKALENFLFENNLLAKIDDVLKNNPAAADDKIKELFLSSEMPLELREELDEGFDSLSIDQENPSATRLMKAGSGVQNLLLVPSPNYSQHPEDHEGIVRSFNNKENLYQGIKSLWAEFFKTKNIEARKKKETGFKIGIIAQKLIEEYISGMVYVDKSKELFIKTYFGLFDFDNNNEFDSFKVNRDLMNISFTQVNHQDTKIIIDQDKLDRIQLAEKGSKQKGNDKEIIELARLAKRANVYLEKNIKVYFGIKKSRPYVLFCNELSDTEPEDTSTTEEIKPEEKPFTGPLEINIKTEEPLETPEAKQEIQEQAGIEIPREPETQLNEPQEEPAEPAEDPAQEPSKDTTQEPETPPADEPAEEEPEEDLEEPKPGEPTEEPGAAEEPEPQEEQTQEHHIELPDPEVKIITPEQEVEIALPEQSDESPEDEPDNKPETPPDTAPEIPPEPVLTNKAETEGLFFPNAMGLTEDTDEPGEPKKPDDPTEPGKPEEDPINFDEILYNSETSFNKLVLNSHFIILERLKKIYKQIFDKEIDTENETIEQIVPEIKKVKAVPHEEDIIRIEKLKDKFLNEPDSLTLEEIHYTLDTAKKFIREFK